MFLVKGPWEYFAIREESGLDEALSHEREALKLNVGESAVMDVNGLSFTYKRIPRSITINCMESPLEADSLGDKFAQIVEYLFDYH